MRSTRDAPEPAACLVPGLHPWQGSSVSGLDFLVEKIRELRTSGLYREIDDGERRAQVEVCARRLDIEMIDASSNDYLSYASEVSRETSPDRPPLGSGASRLIHGTRREHRELEAELATWVKQPKALLFASGYAANVGTISALAQPGDVIVSDALNHASIVDGCRLSGAQIEVTAHCRADAMESVLATHAGKRRCWVVSETYFSMDGDSPDLRRIRKLCDAYDTAMIVDEAHALGVFGPQGSGVCRACGVIPDVVVGTFGKSVAAQGAFVASNTLVRDWIWNRARSFVYSTAISPMLASLVMKNVLRLRADELRRQDLVHAANRFRANLAERGIRVVPESHGPIIPILLTSPQRAMQAAATLGDLGVLVQAIRPPTVPENSSRVRVTLHAGLTQAQLSHLTEAVIQACQE